MMKRSFVLWRRLFFVALGMALVISLLGVKRGAQAMTDVIAGMPEEILFTIQSPPLELDQTDAGTVFSLEGFSQYGVPGQAVLPHKMILVAVPPDADLDSLRFEITDQKVQRLEGTYRAVTGIEDVPEGRVSNPLERLLRQYGPFESTEAAGPLAFHSTGQMRKWVLVQFDFAPVQYDAASGAVEVVQEMTVRMQYNRSRPMMDEHLMADTVADDVAREKILNYAQAKAWYKPFEESVDQPQVVYNYVIITTNAIVSGSSKLDDFELHQESNRGHSVLVVTETQYGGLTGQTPNGTAEKIRKWLQNNYVTYSIQYVLLIGNPDPDDPTISDTVGDVPMKMMWPRQGAGSDEDSPTDAFYADMTGNWNLDGDIYFGEYTGDYSGVTGGVDFASELWVGRIPVYTSIAGWATTLDNILQKIMDYENEGTITWRKNALLPMSFSAAGYDGAPLSEQMKADYLNGNGYSSWTMYQQGSGACGVDSSYTSSQELRGGTGVRDRWAANDYGLVVWWGHGSSTSASVGYDGCWDGTLFSSTYTTSLDDDHPSIVYLNSCTNGYPEVTNNVGYSLLIQGGAATVSASRVSWFNTGVGYGSFDGSTTNSGIGYEFSKRIVQGLAAGPALMQTKSSMTPESNTRLMNFYDFNLYGDPSLSINSQGTFAPSAPTGLTAIALSHASIRLNWTDTSSNEQLFYIERSPNGSTSWVVLGSVGPNVTTYTNTGLLPHTRYYYRVRAWNSVGYSGYTNTANTYTLYGNFLPFILRQ